MTPGWISTEKFSKKTLIPGRIQIIDTKSFLKIHENSLCKKLKEVQYSVYTVKQQDRNTGDRNTDLLFTSIHFFKTSKRRRSTEFSKAKQ